MAERGPVATVTERGIDPRGPRFGAGVSATILGVAVVLGDTAGGTAVLALAAVLFAIGTARGPQGSIQGWAFRRWIRPHLAAPLFLEEPAPPRFAQTVGLVVTVTGLALSPVVGLAVPVAGAIALVAAFLNAAFGYCLGCEMYLALRRLRSATARRAGA